MSNCISCSSCDKNCFATFRDEHKMIDSFEYDFNIHSKPKNIILGLTNRCSMSCPYCFVYQGPSDMTLETAEQSIEWGLSNCEENERPFVNFFGGEPLLLFNEIIVPVVEKYYDKVDFGITTNGADLDEDKVDFFRKYQIQPLLSFDGVPEVQNTQRPGKGFNSFNKVLNNIPYLLLRFPDIVMRATVTKLSIPYLYETVLMAEELGFKEIFFCPNAFEDWNEEDEKLIYEQFNKIGLYIYKKLRNNEIPVKIKPFSKYVTSLEEAADGNMYMNNDIMRCGLGTTSCAITPNGDIIPCQEKISHPTYILGNIYDGIDKNQHKKFLENYFQQINNINCNKKCNDKIRLFCLNDICPSRMEDLEFKISSAACIFTRTSLKIGMRLAFLCSYSSFPHIKEYFEEGEFINEN